MSNTELEASQSAHRSIGLSYKFQRLRERIRQAVASGELSGKLPGERELARRFHVNAKTLSKALTDLAAEGLLSRSIGRGTFVRGAEASAPEQAGAWLILTDSHSDSELVRELKSIHDPIHVTHHAPTSLRQLLNQFNAVIDLAADTPATFLRDLLVRGIPVVAVGRERRTFSTNAVLADLPLAASHLVRMLALAGHRKLLTVEGHRGLELAQSVRRSAGHYGENIYVDSCSPAEIIAAVAFGATACICDSAQSARQVMSSLTQNGISVPGSISVTALGCSSNDYPCTGHYVSAHQQAEVVAELLRSGQPTRPTTLWLTGTLIDRGTVASVTNAEEQFQPSMGALSLAV